MKDNLIYLLICLALVILLLAAGLFFAWQRKNRTSKGKTPHYRRDVYVNGGVDMSTGQMANSNLQSFNGMDTGKYGTLVINPNGNASKIRLGLTNRKTGEYYECCFSDRVVIGRGSANYIDNMLIIPTDKSISGLHCRISVASGIVFAEDLNSANHTYLNGVQITHPSVIDNGDVLKLGRSSFNVTIR